MMSPETIEKMKASKLDREAEARKNGEDRVKVLIGDSPDYDLLHRLYYLVNNQNNTPNDTFGELLDYIDLEGFPVCINECEIDGFCSEVIQIYEKLTDAARVDGEYQAKTLIGNEQCYESFCFMHQDAIAWKSFPDDFDINDMTTFLNYDALRPLWVTKFVIDGFYSAIIQMHDEFEASLA